jgi:hypothetical protein
MLWFVVRDMTEVDRKAGMPPSRVDSLTDRRGLRAGRLDEGWGHNEKRPR